MLWIKEHKGILAICDEKLLGRKITDGKITLDLAKYRAFYEGEKVREDVVLEKIRTAKSINAVGKIAVNLLKKSGFNTRNAIKIANIPHLQIYNI